MKNIFRISGLMLLAPLIFLMHSCKKDKPILPTVTTTVVTEISYTTATSGGDVTNNGGAPIVSRGVCWNTSADPTIANSTTTESGGLGAFTSNITQLTQNTLYYVKAYATNSAGTGYGNQVSFTTSQVEVPVLTTTEITAITQTTAASGGNITDDKGRPVTARGVCWSTNQNPTIADTKSGDGTGTGIFIHTMVGLTPGTIYYVRAYATNSVGTAYGTQVSFTTSSGGQTGTVTDIGSNIYNIVTIGTQIWMAENLKTTKYKDGTAIPLATDGSAWAALETPGYSWYNNDSTTYNATYGALYNWYTVSTGILCPTGWHVPSDAEWTTLITYWGGENVAGGKLKESGTTHWSSPNIGATNETGFTALPGGYADDDVSFFYFRLYGGWWSSTGGGLEAWSRCMTYTDSRVYHEYYNKKDGFSVRCVKD